MRGSQLLTSGCPGVDDVFTPFSFSQLSQQLETPTYNYISTHTDEPGYATDVYLYDNSFETAMKVGQLRTKEAAFTHRKISFQHRQHTVILCTLACGIF